MPSNKQAITQFAVKHRVEQPFPLCLWALGSVLAGTGSMAPDAGLEAAEERLAATAA